ncbi:MAG: signal peptidase I [Desulfobulbaceae bacterium]|nr:signal peptidase I [Desulfobulbaceae bacterium]
MRTAKSFQTGGRELSQSKKKSIIREYLEAIIIALILALFIRTFVVQAFKIPSGSMIPTLLIGDHILVNKFCYGIKNPFTGETWIPLGTPERLDVVVFKYPENPSQDFIKRVIGLPGDRIEIHNKKVYINGNLLNVKYAVHMDPNIYPGPNPPRDNFGPVTVPPHSLFVMGDNRDNSHDSRFWGFVDYTALKGKAFMLYWSWNKEQFSVRWRRIGNLIH